MLSKIVDDIVEFLASIVNNPLSPETAFVNVIFCGPSAVPETAATVIEPLCPFACSIAVFNKVKKACCAVVSGTSIAIPPTVSSKPKPDAVPDPRSVPDAIISPVATVELLPSIITYLFFKP